VSSRSVGILPDAVSVTPTSYLYHSYSQEKKIAICQFLTTTNDFSVSLPHAKACGAVREPVARIFAERICQFPLIPRIVDDLFFMLQSRSNDL
jgi:hypothetical protein